MRTMRGIGGEAILLVLVLIAMCSKAKAVNSYCWPSYCLSWRLGVEANNIRDWPIVPKQCVRYVEGYMLGGQYERDLSLVVHNIINYADNITLSKDGMDAWILDVDDTCISNLPYYSSKDYGGDPYDPVGFKAWALRASCPAIPLVLRLFETLIQKGFNVFLLTGRDEETLGQATILNLQNQGYSADYRLILRSAAYKGQSAITYKSDIRTQLVQHGYRIVGNVGDQWSDLQGVNLGNRTFKIPNPMYFVP